MNKGSNGQKLALCSVARISYHLYLLILFLFILFLFSKAAAYQSCRGRGPHLEWESTFRELMVRYSKEATVVRIQHQSLFSSYLSAILHFGMAFCFHKCRKKRQAG